MNKDMIDQVILERSQRYKIAVSKDHVRGLVVQVARMNPSHVRTDSGVSFKGHDPVVVWQEVITFGTVDGKHLPILKDASLIQAELNDALNKANTFCLRMIALEDSVDNMLASVK